MSCFMVVRPHHRKKGHHTSEWLKGSVNTDTAEEEALALLADPRDTIVGVYLWNDRWQCFSAKWLRKRNDGAAENQV